MLRNTEPQDDGVTVTAGDRQRAGGWALQVVRSSIFADTEYAPSDWNGAAPEYEAAGSRSWSGGLGFGM